MPGLDNAWFVIPGKLSQSAAAGRDMACRIVRRMLSDPVAWPIWEVMRHDATKDERDLAESIALVRF